MQRKPIDDHPIDLPNRLPSIDESPAAIPLPANQTLPNLDAWLKKADDAIKNKGAFTKSAGAIAYYLDDDDEYYDLYNDTAYDIDDTFEDGGDDRISIAQGKFLKPRRPVVSVEKLLRQKQKTIAQSPITEVRDVYGNSYQYLGQFDGDLSFLDEVYTGKKARKGDHLYRRFVEDTALGKKYEYAIGDSPENSNILGFIAAVVGIAIGALSKGKYNPNPTAHQNIGVSAAMGAAAYDAKNKTPEDKLKALVTKSHLNNPSGVMQPGEWKAARETDPTTGKPKDGSSIDPTLGTVRNSENSSFEGQWQPQQGNFYQQGNSYQQGPPVLGGKTWASPSIGTYSNGVSANTQLAGLSTGYAKSPDNSEKKEKNKLVGTLEDIGLEGLKTLGGAVFTKISNNIVNGKAKGGLTTEQANALVRQLQQAQGTTFISGEGADYGTGAGGYYYETDPNTGEQRIVYTEAPKKEAKDDKTLIYIGIGVALLIMVIALRR